MKKILIMLFLIASMVFSGAVFADDFAPFEDWFLGYEDLQDDGIEVDFVPGEYIIDGINRSEFYLDENKLPIKDELIPERQDVSVNVEVKAYIPCYLWMEVTGNGGQTTIESFGPGEGGIGSASGMDTPYMYFDNEMGGFVNEDWYSIGYGRNAEIRPFDPSDSTDPARYIQACDIFRVNLWSNDAYTYQVESEPLIDVDVPEGVYYLDLQMRTALNGTTWEPITHSFAEFSEVNFGDYDPLISLEAYHQFRVPYDINTPHGKYEGTVIFRAYTI
ncbi:MAG: hypothetical protein KAX49_12450 [Halanaerobiales bacterium]|nr:hypothetical protein [Halanaerobiales bacterium]